MAKHKKAKNWRMIFAVITFLMWAYGMIVSKTLSCYPETCWSTMEARVVLSIMVLLFPLYAIYLIFSKKDNK